MLSVKLKELKNYVKRTFYASVGIICLPVWSADSTQVETEVKSTINNVAPATSGGTTPASDALMPMLLALLFVVFVIFAIAFVAKKMNLTPTNNSHFKLISSMSLGGRERMVIVEVQGEQHAIGVTNNSVNHLFSIENKIESTAKPIVNSSLVKKLNSLFGYTPPQSDQFADGAAKNQVDGPNNKTDK